MKFASKSVAMTPEILKRKLGGEYFKPITITELPMKAGTPVGADGKKSLTAPIGVLLYDVTADDPNASIVVANAVINKANAQANSGVTYDATLIGKLANLIFE